MRSVVPFGQYLLLDKLAVGGMAELFLAKRTGEAGFEKTCVVKRVLPYLAENPDFVRMFLDEARLAARLEHPGVAQVFELGRHQDSYFIAMEYLAGTDLFGLLRQSLALRQPVPVELAVRIALQAAEALHYAHEFKDDAGQPLGIVHRDVSPSNVFVTCQGRVKVLDFGVALAQSRDHRTETGQVKGKASYMSPEQSLGERVDRRADVWALGVVLHELLTGRRLFEGKTTAQVALRVCQGAIAAPGTARADLPSALDRAVMRALERDPALRFPTALAFQEALEGSVPLRPQGNPLATYLTDLFGEPWMQAQLSRGMSAPVPLSVRAGGTEQLEGGTVIDTQMQASTRRSTVAEEERGRDATGKGRQRNRLDAEPGEAATGLLDAELSNVRRDLPRVRRRRWALGLSVLVVATAAATMAWQRLSAAPPPRPASAAPASAPAAIAPEPRPPEPSPPQPAATAPPPVSAAARVVDRPSRSRKSTPPAPRAGPGRLSLVTQPYARVFLKGRLLGTTPLFDLELPAGKHTLRLLGEDGQARTLPVEVKESAATQLRVHLKNLAVEK